MILIDPKQLFDRLRYSLDEWSKDRIPDKTLHRELRAVIEEWERRPQPVPPCGHCGNQEAVELNAYIHWNESFVWEGDLCLVCRQYFVAHLRLLEAQEARDVALSDASQYLRELNDLIKLVQPVVLGFREGNFSDGLPDPLYEAFEGLSEAWGRLSGEDFQ